MRFPLLLVSLSIIVPIAATASAGELVNPIAVTKCADINTFAPGSIPCIATAKPGVPSVPMLPRSSMDPYPGMPRMGAPMPAIPSVHKNPCAGRNLCAYVEKPLGLPSGTPVLAR